MTQVGKVAYPGGAHDADLEAMELRTDTARMAWRALLVGDREAAHLIRGPRPSAMVWKVAIRDELPRWTDPLAEGPWSTAALSEWLALRIGLRILRRHFGRNEEHRAAVLALKERREAAQYGDVAHHLPQAEAMLARRGVRL